MWWATFAWAGSPAGEDAARLDALERQWDELPVTECPGVVAQDVPGALRRARERVTAAQACGAGPECRRVQEEARASTDVAQLVLAQAVREGAGVGGVRPNDEIAWRFWPVAVSHGEHVVQVTRDTAAEADGDRFVFRVLQGGAEIARRTGGAATRDPESYLYQQWWNLPHLTPPYVVEVAEVGAPLLAFEVVSICEVRRRP